ncbi:exonuclease domain-containing protein [Cellulomonas carbonis]|uniref:DNA polymerase III subunit epsilon n=1 Tax=Cellulomonas carbonis T26 TaxID=947969 RepID=A0A0A0BPR2_9CELL|nr:exonuclease domain-containing protein [Cellulomonas carbonis]KGM09926.1 DNA polymerase III subunit epsilon [Cellulomonas carbonis T26]GGC10381.1 DNA polymerase III subunit epsilon [Cellulomonas carbonis]
MGWVDGPVMGFDTETTGVDVGTDRIVTAALVHREGTTTTVTSWLIDPGVEIPEAAAAIHGITTDHARRHGRPPRGALDQIAGMLADALLRGEPVVAFNASFDLSLLDAELRRHALPTLADRIARDVRVVLDPLVLDRAFDRYRRGKRRLGDLCAHYEVEQEDRLHTADVDVRATLDVLGALARCFPELAETDLDVLHERQVAAHRRWAAGYNLWRAEQGLPGPGAEGSWPMRVLEDVLVGA